MVAEEGGAVWEWMFDARPYMPRVHCGAWSPWLIRASVAADFVTCAAFVGIAAALLSIWWRRRRDLRYPAVPLLFASFIGICALTHAHEVLVFLWPAYRYFVIVKAELAAVSLLTLLWMPPVLRYARTAPTPEYLARLVDDGAAKAARLQEAHEELMETHRRLTEYVRRLERREASGTRPESLEDDLAVLKQILAGLRQP